MTAEVAAALTWPVLSGAAVGVLLLVVLAGEVVGRVVTVAHEAGHMTVALVTGHGVDHFYLNTEQQGGATQWSRNWRWGPTRIVMWFAGYSTPPLVGLGGAALLRKGLAWPVLWTAVALLVLAWVKARDEVTSVAVLAVALGAGYVGLYGTAMLRAGFAAGLVLLLLIGGVRGAVISSVERGSGSDADQLAHDTFIPAVLWRAAYVSVSLLCLWQGVLILAR